MRWQEKSFNQKGFFAIEGYDDLAECQKLRLQKLYHWRFETARRTNRAPFLILSDKAIVDLSKEERIRSVHWAIRAFFPLRRYKPRAEIVKMLTELRGYPGRRVSPECTMHPMRDFRSVTLISCEATAVQVPCK